MPMRTPHPFRWVEASKVRHAIPADALPAPDEEITAICGQLVVLEHLGVRAEGWHPECRECDRVWREVDDIPRMAAVQ